jgi:hypothetical protein
LVVKGSEAKHATSVQPSRTKLIRKAIAFELATCSDNQAIKQQVAVSKIGNGV